MKVRFLADAHFPFAATQGLLRRGIDIITAQEDGSDRLDDLSLLRRSTILHRVLVTQDADLLREGSRLQSSGERFTGIIYGHQRIVSIGNFVLDISTIAEETSLEDWISRVEYLPLRRS